MFYYQYANPRTLSISPRNRYTSLPAKPAKPMGNLIEGANVRVTTGNPTADTILKWGFWIGIGLATYRLYRVVRYDDPFIHPSYRLPPAWEANPRRRRSRGDFAPFEIEKDKMIRARLKKDGVKPPAEKYVIYDYRYRKDSNSGKYGHYIHISELPGWYRYDKGDESWEKVTNRSKSKIIRDKKRALELYEPGTNLGVLARYLGVSSSWLRDILKKEGVFLSSSQRGVLYKGDEPRELPSSVVCMFDGAEIPKYDDPEFSKRMKHLSGYTKKYLPRDVAYYRATGEADIIAAMMYLGNSRNVVQDLRDMLYDIVSSLIYYRYPKEHIVGFFSIIRLIACTGVDAHQYIRSRFGIKGEEVIETLSLYPDVTVRPAIVVNQTKDNDKFREVLTSLD